MPPEPNPQQQSRAAETRSAAQSSLVAAVGITLLKLFTGLLTGSLGLLSEAAHSGVDLLASAVTLLAVNASDRPADEDHNYGHGKLENLSAAVESGLMFASCYWIAHAAILRILHRTHLDLRLSWWPFLVLALSITVDFTRSRALRKVAIEHGSQALAADSLHFATDIWSSTAVLLGLTATWLGERLHLPGLELADPIAALIVAALILIAAVRLTRNTVDSLLDATPAELRAQQRAALIRDVESVDGVLSADRVRTRRSGPDIFVDLTLSLPRNLTFQRTEQINAAVTAAVQRTLPNADVVIHAVPAASLSETVFDRIRAIAAQHSLSVHDVSVRQDDGALRVEQHLELPETISLRDAHNITTELETQIRRELPAITSLLTHIESEPVTIAASAQSEASANLEQQLRNTAAHFPEILDVHEISVTRGHGGAATSIQVNCHCTLPDDLPMSRVHEVITNFESEFRLDHPNVHRVLIHPEPATDNMR